MSKSSNGSDTHDEPARKKPSPRERAQAHLRRMMRAAGIAGAAVSTAVPAAACGPKSDDDGASASQSTTWDDPCFPDGCDPLPPPETSDSATTGSDTTAGSTTWDDPCFPDGCDPLPPPTTSDTTAADSTTGQTDTDTDTGSGTSGTGTGTSTTG